MRLRVGARPPACARDGLTGYRFGDAIGRNSAIEGIRRLNAAIAASTEEAASSGDDSLRSPADLTPTIDPCAFSTAVNNPYFPLTPGARAIFEASVDGARLASHAGPAPDR